MELDPEISAMNDVLEAFKYLDNGERKRIVDWLTARFKLDEPFVPGQTAVETIERPPIPRPTRLKPGPKKKTEADGPPLEKDVTHYDTVMDLFAEANAKKVSSKILLMAAYLQEKLNIKEISSFDINSRLKRIRHGVTNISSSINGLLNRDPKLMDVIEKPGSGKGSRRKFKVTDEGLRIANGFLK